jgi:hypothetical protein
MTDVTLLSSIVETPLDRGVPGITTISLSGEPYATAIVNAVVNNYHRITGRQKPDEENLQALVGEKVTVILGGENLLGSGMLIAREGKIFEGQRGLAILPKGKRTKGYSLDPSRVLDVFPGWVSNVAEANVTAVRHCYPELVNLTQERLERLPRDSDECSMALLGTNPVFGGPDCIWLIGEYWPEDDICDTNVLLIRPEFGTSEHGSCYGKELLRNRSLGEIVGFEPISFAEAIHLCEIDFDDACSQVFGLVTA